MITSISKSKVNNIISLLKQLYKLKTIKTTIVDTFILYVTTLSPKLNIKQCLSPLPAVVLQKLNYSDSYSYSLTTSLCIL